MINMLNFGLILYSNLTFYPIDIIIRQISSDEISKWYRLCLFPLRRRFKWVGFL